MAEPAKHSGAAATHPRPVSQRDGSFSVPIRPHVTPSPRRRRRSAAPLWAALGILGVLGLAGYLWHDAQAPATRKGPAPPIAARSPSAEPAPPADSTPAVTPREATPPSPAQADRPAPRPSRLRVLAVSPTHRTFNYRDTPIQIEFSHDVRPDTIPPALKVTPSVDGEFSWPAPNRVVFAPRGLWEHATSYLVTLERGITDVTGLDELEPMSWEFSTVRGYFFSRDIRPILTADCQPCHRQDGSAARIPLDAHRDVLRFVVPGNGDGSRLVTALRDQHHEGQLSPQALQKLYRLRDWIAVNRAAD